MSHGALLVITDGRKDCLQQTMRSLYADGHVGLHAFRQHILVNDSLDEAFGEWLQDTFGRVFEVLHPTDGKRGFAGAIQAGWDQLAHDIDWLFHLEDDFTFNATVPLARMLGVLSRHPELAQVVLKRQPWNAQERAAGGIVEQHPDDYSERREGLDVWTEHRRFFSTNVSVYPARLCRLRWPQEPQSEGLFTHRLLKDPLVRFAFWGAKHDPPAVTHIGAQRVGEGY